MLTIDPKYFEKSRSKSPSKNNDNNSNAINDHGNDDNRVHQDGNYTHTCESNIQINDRIDEIEKCDDDNDKSKQNKNINNKDKNAPDSENLEFQSVVPEW